MNALNRREMLKKVSLGLGYLGAGGLLLRLGTASARPFFASPPSGTDSPLAETDEQAVASTPAPWWLIAPYAKGSEVGGARILDMTPVRDGVVSVELETADKRHFQVHICRRDNGLVDNPPPARTELYDFLLQNGGKGDKRTTKAEGTVVKALAEAARRNEKNAKPLAVDTMRQRWARQSVER